MATTVSKVEVWTGEIEDRVGGLASKLEPLAAAGVNLGFIVARRQPQLPGKGVVFLGPITGAKGVKAAAAAGLTKSTDMVAVRVEAPDKAGACFRIAEQLADAGINLRGLSASVIGKKYVVWLAFDSDQDATQASRLLRAK